MHSERLLLDMPGLTDRQDRAAWTALCVASTQKASAQAVEAFLGGLGKLGEILRLVWD